MGRQKLKWNFASAQAISNALPVSKGWHDAGRMANKMTTFTDFVATQLGDLDAVAHDYFASGEFDRLLVETVQATFPAHEHEQFVAHYRGLLGAWVADQA